MTEYFQERMLATGVKLLWGTANLFSHPRYMSGAATNPDPDVFAFAAAQVKNAIDATHKLHGVNYVLWGGREGYETLLNTDMKRELNQLGRFLSMVVEYKHRIGFKGAILVEPKPQEPTKHQYDYDVATVYGFLQRFGLEKEVKVNVEVGHAVLAKHSFEHEIATATALGILGSVDANRNDYQSGWDTDQFPNNAAELVPAMYYILKAGGLGAGRLQLRCEGPPAVDRPRRPALRPHRRARHLRPGAARRRAADRRRQIRRLPGRALRRLERRESAGDARARRDARRRRRARRGGRDRPEAALGTAGMGGEPHQSLSVRASPAVPALTPSPPCRARSAP